MIAFTPPNDVRGFIHKKALKLAKRAISTAVPLVASFVPGGSTALALAGRFLPTGGAGALPRQLVNRVQQRRIDIASLDERLTPQIRRHIAEGTERSWRAHIAHGHAFGMTASGGFLPGFQSVKAGRTRPSSVPPVNPVRQAVIQAKPVGDVVAPRPRARIPTTRLDIMPFHKDLIRRGRDFLQDRITGGGGSECPPGSFPSPLGCVDPSAVLPGGDAFIGAGAPVMGQFGAAYEGTSRLIRRTTCLPGDLVGADGLCYNRKSLSNKERMWPKGRAPLLTGGEMRAISIASRAAGKFERTQKRLQKLGMIKKPSRARAPKLPPHQHQITSGG